jgi:hypothetical protein
MGADSRKVLASLLSAWTLSGIESFLLLEKYLIEDSS